MKRYIIIASRTSERVYVDCFHRDGKDEDMVALDVPMPWMLPDTIEIDSRGIPVRMIWEV